MALRPLSFIRNKRPTKSLEGIEMCARWWLLTGLALIISSLAASHVYAGSGSEFPLLPPEPAWEHLEYHVPGQTRHYVRRIRSLMEKGSPGT